jgi:hypothetical protein
MTKNIRVVDESGNDYGTTYLRRARGLVTTGRARFTGESTICLARPPNHFLEDHTMDDEYTRGTAENGPGLTGLTINDVLARIDRIINDTEYLKAAVKSLGEMTIPPLPGGVSPAEDVGNRAKAEALAGLVKSREETNRQILGLLEKMYDDLRRRENPEQGIGGFGRNVHEMSEILRALKDSGVDMESGELTEAVAATLLNTLNR